MNSSIKTKQNKGKSRLWIMLFTAAFAIRIVFSFFLMHDWDGFVFAESAKNMLHGVTPYQTVQNNDPNIYPDSDRDMTEQWYGYPPLPLLMFTASYAVVAFSHIQANLLPFLTNVSIKIPFIIGDLLCAYLMIVFLRKYGEKLASRAALLILFNPLLIWISSAWGMFDIWIVNFLLLFLLAIRSKNAWLAGIFLALAPQVKLFPLFFLPAIIVFFLQNIPQTKKRIQFLALFFVTTLTIDIPFFISSPQGFLNQNLIMHMARPPQGIALSGILDYLGYIYSFNVSTFVTIGSLLMLASIVIFNLFSLAYVKGKESNILTVILLIYTSVLLFNKVVNEQYYVVLVALLILLTHFPRVEHVLFKRRFLVLFEEIATVSVLIASIVLGFHFLTFLPFEIASKFFKASTNYLVYYFSHLVPQLPLYAYPNSLWTYYNTPVTLTYIILVPLIVMSGFIVFVGFYSVFQARWGIKNALASSFSALKPTRLNVMIILIVLLITASQIPRALSYLKKTNALKLVTLVDADEKPIFPVNPNVGTFYNVWWNNPSHYPEDADSAWSKTTLTPQIGYYTSKNSYYVQHIEQMKGIGIDFAVISYHLYDRDRYLSFGSYAEKLGFFYSPLIETGDALSDPKLHGEDPDGEKNFGFAVNPVARDAVKTYLLSSIADTYKSPALLRINGKPVVFIYDGSYFYPSWDSESKENLAERIVEHYKIINSDNPYAAISDAWDISIHRLGDIVNQYPEDIPSFNGSTIQEQDYKQAFLGEYADFWSSIRNEVEKKVGPLYLISAYAPPILNENNVQIIQSDAFLSVHVFDNEFFYSLSNTWAAFRYVASPANIMSVWEQQQNKQRQREKTLNRHLFMSVNPMYDDTNVRGKLGFQIPATINEVSIYNWTWQQAIDNKADYVLIATWNEFFEGSTIEPTKEFGSYYLDQTKKYINAFKQAVPIEQ